MKAGTIWVVAAPITAEIIVLKRFAAALGLLLLTLFLSGTFAGAIAPELSTGETKFIGIHWVCIVAASVCMPFLRSWQIALWEEYGAGGAGFEEVA